jgi:hypothetical protein
MGDAFERYGCSLLTWSEKMTLGGKDDVGRDDAEKMTLGGKGDVGGKNSRWWGQQWKGGQRRKDGPFISSASW